jgi:type I restriction enzyme, S subunit
MDSEEEPLLKQTEVGLIPADWEIKSADTFCQRVTDGTHATPGKQEKGHYLITSRHIKEGGLDFNCAYFINDDDFEEANRRSKVNQWDVIFGMIGTIGEVFLEKSTKIDYAIKNVGLFKCGNELFGTWLFFFMKSDIAKEYIRKSRSGTTQEYITLELLRKFPIIYPKNIAEMKRIIKVLSTIQNRIDLNRLINKNLEAVGEAVFRHWFIDFEFPNEIGKPYKSSGGEIIFNERLGLEIPKRWTASVLTDIAEITLGGTPKRSESRYWDGNVNWASAGDIANSDNLYIFNTPERITEEGVQNSNAKVLPSETIVVTARGTVGEIRLLGAPCSVNQTCYALSPESNADSYFLYYVLKKSISQMTALSHGTVFETITMKTFAEIIVTIPSLEKLTAFNNLVRPLFNRLKNNTQENATLSEIRDRLLPKLMSGKIRAPILKEYGDLQ